MNICVAILAACAGALMLTVTLTHAGEPVAGVEIIRGAGKKITENESPRPRDRKNQQQKTGFGTGKSEIFDRWGNSRK